MNLMKLFWLLMLNSCNVVKTRPALTINPVIDPGFASHSSNGLTLSWWRAPTSESFRVDYASPNAPAWTTFSNIITSINGTFNFTDNGTNSGGFGDAKFCRLRTSP